MLVGEHVHIGAVVPTIPLYASLDTEPRHRQRTFAAQTLQTNIQFQGLPPGLPGVRYYSDLGQYSQVNPRGFGQQMSASGRAAGKLGPNQGMFGLGLPMMPGSEGATVEEENDLFGVEDSLF
jgi:hypothetical protein